MPSAAIPPSVEVGRMLRERRKKLRLSLTEVARRLEISGSPIPHSTLVRIEQGKLDAGVRRLHQLLRLYGIPATLVADLVALEDLASVEPVDGDAESFYERAVAAWRVGDLPRGLGYFFAFRQKVGDDPASKPQRHRAALGLAIAARDLGRPLLAKSLVEELLLDEPEAALATRSMILQASIWRALGSLDVAFAFLQLAKTRLPADDDALRAFAEHQEAKLLQESDRREEASAALERALAAYRAGGDAYGEARARILGVAILEETGRLDAAVEEARESIEFSDRHAFARLAVTSRVELGRLLWKTGDRDGGLQTLREAASRAILLEYPEPRFRAHYHLWKAYESTGQDDLARVERNTACALVRFVDDTSAEAKEVHALLATGGTHVA